MAQDELHDDRQRLRREPGLRRAPASSTRSTAAPSSRRPAVSITTEGPHTLYTRVVDTAGNVSDWREDTIGIDKTIPTLTVDCGVDDLAQHAGDLQRRGRRRRSPAWPTLTAARGAGVAEPIGGTYAVESDGAAT